MPTPACIQITELAVAQALKLKLWIPAVLDLTGLLNLQPSFQRHPKSFLILKLWYLESYVKHLYYYRNISKSLQFRHDVCMTDD